jgi:hypothetical protein
VCAEALTIQPGPMKPHLFNPAAEAAKRGLRNL